MFELFTDRARKVMALANQEVQRHNHQYIGTEHIFLGLVKEGSGIGAAILRNSGSSSCESGCKAEGRAIELGITPIDAAGNSALFTSPAPTRDCREAVCQRAHSRNSLCDSCFSQANMLSYGKVKM